MQHHCFVLGLKLSKDVEEKFFFSEIRSTFNLIHVMSHLNSLYMHKLRHE